MHEAARTVAALLDLAAVGVEYPITKIDVGPRGLLHKQDLVAAHTEVPVRDAPYLVGTKRYVFAHAIEYDKIVAGPCIFVKRRRRLIVDAGRNRDRIAQRVRDPCVRTELRSRRSA